jgi:serine/threonine protein phosphatase PrpC
VSHQYAAEFVRKRLLASSSSFADVEDIAHKLTQHALDRKSQDNVTLVIVLFPVAFRGELLAQVATIQVQPAAGAAAASAAAAGSGAK